MAAKASLELKNCMAVSVFSELQRGVLGVLSRGSGRKQVITKRDCIGASKIIIMVFWSIPCISLLKPLGRNSEPVGSQHLMSDLAHRRKSKGAGLRSAVTEETVTSVSKRPNFGPRSIVRNYAPETIVI